MINQCLLTPPPTPHDVAPCARGRATTTNDILHTTAGRFDGIRAWRLRWRHRIYTHAFTDEMFTAHSLWSNALTRAADEINRLHTFRLHRATFTHTLRRTLHKHYRCFLVVVRTLVGHLAFYGLHGTRSAASFARVVHFEWFCWYILGRWHLNHGVATR